jgi:hypothetical protein
MDLARFALYSLVYTIRIIATGKEMPCFHSRRR